MKPDEAPAEQAEENSDVSRGAEARPEETGRNQVLEPLWKRVLEAWDEDKPHGALLEYALRSNALPEIAGRYRALRDDPDKGQRARKQLDAIVLSATQMMLAMKTPPRTKMPASITLSALGVCALLVGLLMYALVRH